MKPVLDAINDALAHRHPGQGLRTRATQKLFHQADPSDAVYLLLEGELRCFVSSPSTEAGETNTLLLRAPALVGDRDVLWRQPSLETVECLTACRLLKWSDETLLSAWEHASDLHRHLGLDLTARYAASLFMRQLQNLAPPLWLALLCHDITAAGRDWPSHLELARLMNGSTRSVTRAGNELRKQGILLGEKSDRALDVAKLAEALGGPVRGVFHSASSS